MTKILVVSEALGEPSHKRGIFHFTRELIRSLAGDGHELTLLVETTRRYRKLRQRQQRTRLLPDGSRLIELLALYRFLDEADMNAPVMRSSGGLRRTVDWCRGKLRAATSLEFAVSFLRAVHLLPAGVSLIENHADGLEYIPTDLRHLKLFGDFLLEPGFYSYQDTSALLRLPPPRVDARGYDVILVDTPTRVAIQQARRQGDLRRARPVAAHRPQAQRRRNPAVPVAPVHQPAAGRRARLRLALQPGPVPRLASAVRASAGAGGLSPDQVRCTGAFGGCAERTAVLRRDRLRRAAQEPRRGHPLVPQPAPGRPRRDRLHRRPQPDSQCTAQRCAPSR